MIKPRNERLEALVEFFFCLILVVSIIGAVTLLTGCSNAAATSETVKCELITSEPVFQVDGFCGKDKDGRQMVSVGSFENPKRTGCVSLQRFCVFEQ